MKAIDFGCGEKESENRKQYDEYVGIDMRSKGLETGIKCNIDIESDLNDLKRLPFRDRYFDVVIAENIIEHLINLKPLIAEMNRLSRDKIIIEVPNALSIDNRISMLFGKNVAYPRPFMEIDGRPTSHQFYFDINSLDNFCKQFFQDFKVIKKEYKYTGRCASVLNHLTNTKPSLFSTVIRYELERTK